jgi:hypothetical protein
MGNIWRFVKKLFPRRFVRKFRCRQSVYEVNGSGNSISPMGNR